MKQFQERQPVVNVGDATVEPVEYTRNLGGLFDQYISIAPQANSVHTSMYYHLHQIGKIRKHLTKEACATAVNSLVLSRLDYNNGLLCELYLLPYSTAFKLLRTVLLD